MNFFGQELEKTVEDSQQLSAARRESRNPHLIARPLVSRICESYVDEYDKMRTQKDARVQILLAEESSLDGTYLRDLPINIEHAERLDELQQVTKLVFEGDSDVQMPRPGLEEIKHFITPNGAFNLFLIHFLSPALPTPARVGPK